jgi:hypothetical protein
MPRRRLICHLLSSISEIKLIDLAQVERECLSGTVENKPEDERILSQLLGRQHSKQLMIGDPGVSVAEELRIATEARLVLKAELLSGELQRLLLKVYANLLI